MMTKLLTTLLMMITTLTASAGQRAVRDKRLPYDGPRIKVACVGNSVTYGYGLDRPATEAYPALLQKMLRDSFHVRNFGHNGATLMHGSGTTYRLTDECRRALDFKPDIVVIDLGLNDVDPIGWTPDDTAFDRDYHELIHAFRSANPQCRIWLCLMTPITDRYPGYTPRLRHRYAMIQAKIADVARREGLPLIDLHQPLRHRTGMFLADGIHPDSQGAYLIANTIHNALSGHYGGLRMPPIYTHNMVLQRDRPLTISGTATPGDTVTLRIAGQTSTAPVAPTGHWSATLNPLTADTGLTLEVSTPQTTLRYTNVAVGDVWLCSGQSNMAFPTDSTVPTERDALLAFAAAHPDLRLFLMEPTRIPFPEVWDERMLHDLNDLEYFHPALWMSCDKSTAARFSAIATAFARRLQDTIHVPIGLILNAVDGSPLEAWIDRETLEEKGSDMLGNPRTNPLIHPWVRQRAALNLQGTPSPMQRHPYDPTYLFDSGLLPLGHFPVRGVLWYQGESNAHDTATYARFFPLLVYGWRRYFSDPTLPFFFVQLSATEKPNWGPFRDMQRRLPDRIPSCYMAVSSDRGDSVDIHFPRKMDIGERLAGLALRHSYGHTALITDGPLITRAVLRDGAVTLHFHSSAGLRTSDGHPVRTLELAGDDGQFHPAEAEIIGETIRVHTSLVPRPRRVRYAWASFNRANLTNGAGLPASTFAIEIEAEEGAQ